MVAFAVHNSPTKAKQRTSNAYAVRGLPLGVQRMSTERLLKRLPRSLTTICQKFMNVRECLSDSTKPSLSLPEKSNQSPRTAHGCSELYSDGQSGDAQSPLLKTGTKPSLLISVDGQAMSFVDLVESTWKIESFE